MKTLILPFMLFGIAGLAWAGGVTTEGVKYTAGDLEMNGYLAYPSDLSTPAPGILIVHEWTGLNDYARTRAQQLARMGYVAFAADMYGNGKVAADRAEAGQLSGALKQGDRMEMRRRVTAALETLKSLKQTDPARTAAMGYCFGGTVVLELARTGADLNGVVSFHGGLSTPESDQSPPVHASVLVLHGADDPHVPPEEVAAFENEMRRLKVDWQLVSFGHAVHSFTNPGSGNNPSSGVAYNADADRRSWQYMTDFFAEILGSNK